MAHKRLLVAVLAVLGLEIGCGGGGGGAPPVPSDSWTASSWTDPRLDLGEGDDHIVAIDSHGGDHLAVVVNRRHDGKQDVWCGRIDKDTGARDESFLVQSPFEKDCWADKLVVVDGVGYVFGDMMSDDKNRGFCFGYDLDDGTIVEQWTFPEFSWGLAVDPWTRMVYTVEFKSQYRAKDDYGNLDEPATLTVSAYALTRGGFVLRRTHEIADYYNSGVLSGLVGIHENRLIVAVQTRLAPNAKDIVALYALDKPTGNMLGFHYFAPIPNTDISVGSMVINHYTGEIFLSGDDRNTANGSNSRIFLSKIGSDLSVRWTAIESDGRQDMLSSTILLSFDHVYVLGGVQDSFQSVGLVRKYTHGGARAPIVSGDGATSDVLYLIPKGGDWRYVRCGTHTIDNSFKVDGVYLGYLADGFSGVRKIRG